MPKSTRETIQLFNARMLKKFPQILDVESSILYCKLCHCNINGGKVFTVQQHFRTVKHQSAVQNNLDMMAHSSYADNEDRKVVIAAPPAPRKIPLDAFSLDLCTTFLEANIPLASVDNSAVQILLQKYTKQAIPNETTLRSQYVPALYEKYIQTLQHKTQHKPIWISITETSDSQGQLNVSFVFGLLEEHEKGKSYLLNMTRFERANASSLAAFINNSLQKLWPEGIHYDKVHLAITEAVPYMITALQSLKVLYPNMIYANCLLQCYHKLIEYLREHFPQVVAFIDKCEQVFLKSPYRQHIIQAKYHYLNVPCTTSSSATPGTWLKAALFYHNNFTETSTLLNLFSEEAPDEICIQKAKDLIQNTTIKTDLSHLQQYFAALARSITKLEARDLMLNESLLTIEAVRADLEAYNSPQFIDKFNKIINGNEGLKELIALNAGNRLIKQEAGAEEPQWLYKFVPVICSDVEHLLYAKSLLENDKMFSVRDVKEDKYEIKFYDMNN